MKLLSVIIPAFNMERYLSQTIHSLLVGGDEQSALDIVVVNDGSNDQTSNIAHHLASKYLDVIRVIDKPNGHYGSCINVALKILRGQFVRIIDADDCVISENFRKFIAFLIEKNNEASFATVDCILSDSLRVSPTGVVLAKDTMPIPAGRVLAKTEIPRHLVFPMYAITYRTSILLDNHYLQTEGILYTDTEWMVYPLSWVRSVYYWAGSPVYQYLIGRSGQSVDPNVFRRCMAQRIMMFVRMMREAHNTSLSVADRYRLEFISAFGIMALYRESLGLSGVMRVNESMQEIDEIVRSINENVYQQLDEVPLSPYIRIRALHIWRLKHRFSWRFIWCLRALLKMERLGGAFRHYVKNFISQ